jgi:tetratricopeptide (TPR) repeat protein
MRSPNKGLEAKGKTKKPGPKRSGSPAPAPAAPPIAIHAVDSMNNEAATLLAEALAPRATPRDQRTPRDANGRVPVPERLLLGITLDGIRHVLASRSDEAVAFAKTKAKRGAVDGYVSAVLAKQESLEDGLSSVERLQRSEDGVARASVGRATVFVSWHFGTPVDSLCDALARYVERAGLAPEATFFWISDFSMCQSKPMGADLARLPDIIGAIGHTVMLLEPWDAASVCTPLRRIYCLWELYHTARVGATFAPVMSGEQADAFVAALTASVETVTAALAELDVRTAKSTAPKEREQILDAIDGSIGADRFNGLIGRLITAAVADEARAVVGRLPADAADPALVHAAAALLHEAGDLDGAEPLYRQGLAALRARVGDVHEKTLGALSAVAAFLVDKGAVAEAEGLMREELQSSRDVRGDAHPDTLTSINDLAVLLGDRGDYAAAEPLYREALQTQRETLGDQHPSTILSMNNLASLLRARGEMDEAVALHSEALLAQRATLGDRHASTLASIYNLGCLLAECGDRARAEALLREELAACQETLGGAHPDTVASAENLRSLLGAAPNDGKHAAEDVATDENAAANAKVQRVA